MSQVKQEINGVTVIYNKQPDESDIPQTEYEKGRQEVLDSMIGRMERHLKFLMSIKDDPKTSPDTKLKITHQEEVYIRFINYAKNDKYKEYYSHLIA